MYGCPSKLFKESVEVFNKQVEQYNERVNDMNFQGYAGIAAKKQEELKASNPWPEAYLEETTAVTISNCFGDYSIEIKDTDMTVDQMFEELIIPVMLAAGYQAKSIEDYLDGENDF